MQDQVRARQSGRRFWLSALFMFLCLGNGAFALGVSAEMTLSAPVWFGSNLYSYMPEDVHGVLGPGKKTLMIPLPHGGVLLGLDTPIGTLYGVGDLWVLNSSYFQLGIGYGRSVLPHVESFTSFLYGNPGAHFGLAQLLRYHFSESTGIDLVFNGGAFVTVAKGADLYPGLLAGISFGYRVDDPQPSK